MRRTIYLVFISLFFFLYILNSCSEDSPTETTNNPPIPEDSIPPAAILNLNIISGVDSICVLTWTSPGDDLFEGRASSYEIRYATDSSILKNWTGGYVASNPPTPLIPGETQQFTIHNLIPDSTYYFAIKTSDDSGNVSAVSNIAKETTSPLPSVEIVSPSSGSNVSQLTKVLVNASDDKGVVKVELFANSISVGIDYTPPYEFLWDAHTATDSTVHILFAQVEDTDNNTVGSKTIQCITDTSLFRPGGISNVIIDSITDTSVILIWSKNNELDYKHYDILFENDYQGRFGYKIDNVNDTNHKFVGLLDGEEYEVSCWVTDQFNYYTDTSLFNRSHFTTINILPPDISISKFKLGPSGPNNIEIYWSGVEDHNFFRYEIHRSIDSFQTSDEIVGYRYTNNVGNYFGDHSYSVGTTVYYAVVFTDNDGYTTNTIGRKIRGFGERTSYTALNYQDTAFCRIPYNSNYNFDTSFTIEAWVKPTTWGRHARIIDKTENNGTTTNTEYGLFIYQGLVGIDVGFSDNSTFRQRATQIEITYDKWSHVAATYINNTIIIYVNGIFADKFVVSDLELNNITSDLYVGISQLNSGYYYEGSIDQIRIWNTAKHETEIFDNIYTIFPANEPGLVGQWLFDEGSGQFISGSPGQQGFLGNDSTTESVDPIWISE